MANEVKRWDEGVRAYNNGLSRKDCPYRLIGLQAQRLAEQGQKRTDWINGFNWAQDCDHASGNE
jgi:hypothetical protein